MASESPAGAERQQNERDPLLGDSTFATDQTIPPVAEDALSTYSAENGTAGGFAQKPVAVTPWRAALITASMGLLIFLQTTNISMLTTTQSAIAADLDAYEETSWFTSAYLVGMSSLSPLSGRLSQTFSPRIIIFSATCVFCLGVVLTAFAPTLAVFLLGRAVSGIAAAGIFTTAIIIVLDLVGAKRRGLFVGLLNAGYTTGISLGAVLGGALEPLVGWRILYWAQAPLALVAGFGLLFGIKSSFTSAREARELPLSEKIRRIDYVGALTLSASLVLLLFGLSSAPVRLIPIGGAICILPIFVLNEAYLASEPIIPVTLLKSRGLLLSCLAALGLMMARWAVLFYTPVYALAVRNWAPGAAGTLLIPTNVGFAAGGLLSGWIHIRRSGSFYLSCVLTCAVFPFTLLALDLLATPDSPAVVYIAFLFLNGLLTGAQLNYALAHVLHLTQPSTHFIVTSLLATFRGFAGSFGSAAGGGLFLRTLKSALVAGFRDAGLLPGRAELIRQLVGSPALVGRLEGRERDVAVDAYRRAVMALFLAGVVLSAAVVFVQAGTGWRAPKDPDETEDDAAVEE